MKDRNCSECIWQYYIGYGDYSRCEMSGNYCIDSFKKKKCPYELHSRKELKEIIKSYNEKKENEKL